MLHIIILNKNYFPSKLNLAKLSDKVIVLASPDGAIPVSAYQDESLKNMEVKLLPELKDTASQDGKNIQRITQAMLIGQLTATEKDFEIYTDDNSLLKALAPFTGKKTSAKKKSAAKSSEAKNEAMAKETSAKEDLDPKKDSKAETAKKTTKKTAEEVKVENTSEEAVKEEKAKTAKKPSKVTKAEVKTKPAKLPTQAEVKRVLGAANSSFVKPIMEVIKTSNQITFEMDLRMKLAEAGMDASQCQDLARTINEEFGKMLSASM